MGKGKEPEVTRDRLVLHVDQILLDELTVDDVGRPLGLGTVIVSGGELGKSDMVSDSLTSFTTTERAAIL